MKKNLKMTVILLFMMLLSQSIFAAAAEKAKVFMDVQEYKESDRTLKAACKIENGNGVTNGKLRIYYDAEKVALMPSEAGDVLSEGMHEINDCLTGNKSEGELVLVFAAAQELPAEGSLLNMGFKLKDGVKEGDKLTFNIKAEKLSGDNGSLETETPEIVYTVGKGQEETPGVQDPDNKDENDGKTDGKNDSQDGGKNSGKRNSVKTGDETSVIVYLVLAGGSVALGVGGVVLSRRNKRNN